MATTATDRRSRLARNGVAVAAPRPDAPPAAGLCALPARHPAAAFPVALLAALLLCGAWAAARDPAPVSPTVPLLEPTSPVAHARALLHELPHPQVLPPLQGVPRLEPATAPSSHTWQLYQSLELSFDGTYRLSLGPSATWRFHEPSREPAERLASVRRQLQLLDERARLGSEALRAHQTFLLAQAQARQALAYAEFLLRADELATGATATALDHDFRERLQLGGRFDAAFGQAASGVTELLYSLPAAATEPGSGPLATAGPPWRPQLAREPDDPFLGECLASSPSVERWNHLDRERLLSAEYTTSVGRVHGQLIASASITAAGSLPGHTGTGDVGTGGHGASLTWSLGARFAPADGGPWQVEASLASHGLSQSATLRGPYGGGAGADAFELDVEAATRATMLQLADLVDSLRLAFRDEETIRYLAGPFLAPAAISGDKVTTQAELRLLLDWQLEVLMAELRTDLLTLEVATACSQPVTYIAATGS